MRHYVSLSIVLFLRKTEEKEGGGLNNVALCYCAIICSGVRYRNFPATVPRVIRAAAKKKKHGRVINLEPPPCFFLVNFFLGNA